MGMIKDWVIGILMFLGMYTASAQTKVQVKPLNGLSLTWQIVTNNYNNKPQSRSALLFTTSANLALPPTGWKIYFSFPRQIIAGSVTGGLLVKHITGDLFCLLPTAEFKGIGSAKSLGIEFTSADWVINVSDAPGGFYLVWDDAPQTALVINNVRLEPSTRPEQYLRTPFDKIEAATPASTFAKNKTIDDIPADRLPDIFPTPVSYRENAGSFLLDASVKIEADTAFKSEEQYLKQMLNTLLTPAPPANNDKVKTIELRHKPMATEAYELDITNNHIIIRASAGAGVFYGIQSLKTLVNPVAYQHLQKKISLKNVSVVDSPRFGYRALMLDVARNFQPKSEILKLIDVLSLYKLNVLRFHLTDDEGWRLEIPALPELTNVGSRRGYAVSNDEYLPPALGSGPAVDSGSGSGYYTKADFIAILKYATGRHIHVIPEIESPGHARAAIKAMDARYQNYVNLGQQANAEEYLLRDLNDTSKYTSVQHFNDNVIDVALPSTYRFINTITSELVKMYAEAGAPLKIIHFGGDEVPAGAWQGSPAFKRLMQADTTIHSTDDLWPYYYTRVADILKAYGLYLTAWEETGMVKNKQKIAVINTALLDKNVHLEVWNNVLGWGAEDLAYKQANAGFKVILSCVSNLYFDMAAEKAFDEPGYYWGSYVDIDKVFKFVPYNYFKNTTVDRLGNSLNQSYLADKEKLTAVGKANITGIQGALWGETLKSTQRMEYMLLPKLLGLAERAWAADPEWATTTDTVKSQQLYNRAWSVFVNTLSKRELPRMDFYAGGFHYRIPQPGAVVQDNMVVVNSQLPGFKVYYTTDDTALTPHSKLYTGPIPYLPGIRMALFNSTGRSGRVIEIAR